MLAINVYTFEPSPRQDVARCLRLQNELALQLQNSLPLPMELRSNVAQHLIAEYAVAKNRSLLDYLAFEHSVTLASAITERYATFEGERYVSSLTNEPEKFPKPPRIMYVGEDHLGIRRLIFSDSMVAPQVDCVSGLWWKTLLVKESGTIEFASDVSGRNVLFFLCEDEYVANSDS